MTENPFMHPRIQEDVRKVVTENIRWTLSFLGRGEFAGFVEAELKKYSDEQLRVILAHWRL